MIELRELRFSDISEIELRQEDKERLDSNNWLEVIGKSFAYTLLYDDKILCIGGVCLYRKNFGEAWIMCSCAVDDHPFVTIRRVKQAIEDIMKKCRMDRIQATVRCSRHRAQKFIEFLGFQNEGKLRRYGPDGSDYFMYSRVL